jgi:hypothetical protein
VVSSWFSWVAGAPDVAVDRRFQLWMRTWDGTGKFVMEYGMRRIKSGLTIMLALLLFSACAGSALERKESYQARVAFKLSQLANRIAELNRLTNDVVLHEDLEAEVTESLNLLEQKKEDAYLQLQELQTTTLPNWKSVKPQMENAIAELESGCNYVLALFEESLRKIEAGEPGGGTFRVC